MSFTKEIARLDSQNLKHLGQDWNLPWLEQEASHNEKNPGRAMGKAATSALLWYLGGPALAAESGAAGAATEAGTEVAKTAAEQAAMEAAKQEALNSAQYAAQQGLLSGSSPSFGSGLLGGQGGVGMGSGFSMAPGPGVVAPGKQTAAMMDSAAINAGYPKAAPGYWSNPKLSNAAGKLAMHQATGLMNSGPRPSSPPPQQQYESPPPFYSGGYQGLYMTEEEKRRLLYGY